MNYRTSGEIEEAVAGWFGTRTHVIVPNLDYGLVRHECDLAVLSSSDYLYEVEIKISISDLIRDQKKEKWRDCVYEKRGFRKLWFAMPESLCQYEPQTLIPVFSGLLFVSMQGIVRETIKPTINKLAKKLTDKDKFQLGRLGTMRLWNLKRKQMRNEL